MSKFTVLLDSSHRLPGTSTFDASFKLPGNGIQGITSVSVKSVLFVNSFHNIVEGQNVLNYLDTDNIPTVLTIQPGHYTPATLTEVFNGWFQGGSFETDAVTYSDLTNEMSFNLLPGFVFLATSTIFTNNLIRNPLGNSIIFTGGAQTFPVYLGGVNHVIVECSELNNHNVVSPVSDKFQSIITCPVTSGYLSTNYHEPIQQIVNEHKGGVNMNLLHFKIRDAATGNVLPCINFAIELLVHSRHNYGR